MATLGQHLNIRAKRIFVSPKLRREREFARWLRESLGHVELAVDLGCGARPRNDYNASRILGFDLASNASNGVQAADLSAEPIPLPDSSVDLITAYDFLEHIRRWERRDGQVVFPFIELMSEICRVLRPGGLFYSVTPAYPSKEAFQDPTHVNVITEDTFSKYFCGRLWAKQYGFRGEFELQRQHWRGGHLLSVLRKP